MLKKLTRRQTTVSTISAKSVTMCVMFPQTQNTRFIIDEVHMLSTGAFNALLETLEEPPERIFILATTEGSQSTSNDFARCQDLILNA